MILFIVIIFIHDYPGDLYQCMVCYCLAKWQGTCMPNSAQNKNELKLAAQSRQDFNPCKSLLAMSPCRGYNASDAELALLAYFSGLMRGQTNE